jgi:NAD-dependent deacetylase
MRGHEADELELARRARVEGDLARARAHALAHLGRGDDPDAWVLLGSIAQLEGDLAEAARCHRRAIGIAGDHAPAHAALAVVLAQRGELVTARAHLEAALERRGLGEVAWLRAERQRAALARGGVPLAPERVATPFVEKSPHAAHGPRERARGAVSSCSLERLRELVRGARSIVAITGAGISRASGLETRKELWQRFVRDDAVSAVRFREQPEILWQVVREFWGEEDHPPNEAHHALASLPTLLAIVTQNVDSLHQRAAAAIRRDTEVIELHGTLARTRCVGCAREHGDATVLARSPALPPRCACGAVIRPDVVLFGEHARHLERAVAQVTSADLVLVVGCAMDVSPASELPVLAARAGATIVEIKRTPSRLSDMIPVEHVAGRAEHVLGALGDPT